MTASIAQLGNVTAKNKAATQDVLDALALQNITLQQVWGVGGGDHADGNATDFMVYSNKAWGDWIADFLWLNRDRLGVRWIIWQQRIRSTTPGKPGTWEPMEDRGTPTLNHYDHVHVKWNTSPIVSLPGGGQGGGVPIPLPPAPKPPAVARPRIKVSNLRLGVRSADATIYNRLLWARQGPAYKAAHQAMWMRESSGVYGPASEQVTFDTYDYWHKVTPKNWPDDPRKYGRPVTPGPALIRALGGDPY